MNNDKISKEYYSKTEKDNQNKKTEVGKSLNQGNWDINVYDNDKASSKSKKHSEIEVGQMFSDFGIDAKPFISSKSSSTKEKKAPKAKKASTKKSSKKKSAKKGGAKKRSKGKKKSKRKKKSTGKSK